MNQQSKQEVGSICLYGARQCGFGWLAVVGNDYSKMLGDGEPKEHLSATMALWQAVDALRAVVPDGKHNIIEVFAPGGEEMARVNLNNVPSYGCLSWYPARVYTIDADTLIAASEQPTG